MVLPMLIHNNKQGTTWGKLDHKVDHRISLDHCPCIMIMGMRSKLFIHRRECKWRVDTFWFNVDNEVHKNSIIGAKLLLRIRVHLILKMLDLWMVLWRHIIMTIFISKWELERNKVNGLHTPMLPPLSWRDIHVMVNIKAKDYSRTASLKHKLIKGDGKSGKDDCTDLSSYTKMETIIEILLTTPKCPWFW